MVYITSKHREQGARDAGDVVIIPIAATIQDEAGAQGRASRWQSMRRLLLLLGICVAIFAAAFAARMVFVPNIVAVAYAEEAQSIWALETAFLLQSVENVALLAAGLMLALIIGSVLWPKLRGTPPKA